MSSDSYNSNARSVRSYESYASTNADDRARARADHRKAVYEAREKIDRGEAKRPAAVVRETASLYDAALVRNLITRPAPGTQRAVVALVDRSSSNDEIANHFQNSSGYLTAFLRTVDPTAQWASIYFSDHCDDLSRYGEKNLAFQYVDFVGSTEKDDRILFSSLKNVEPAYGGDLPEAIECALMQAAQIDFGTVPKAERTLVLITDSVPHGMEGWAEAFGEADHGCPNQVSWRAAMRAVREVYGKFVIIGSGREPLMAKFQRKLFETAPGVADETEVALNFIDLSTIKQSFHRNGIVGNAMLFVMARNAGRQSVPSFLAALYAKWLKNPLFDRDTDALAQKRIREFSHYLLGMYSQSEIDAILADVFSV